MKREPAIPVNYGSKVLQLFRYVIYLNDSSESIHHIVMLKGNVLDTSNLEAKAGQTSLGAHLHNHTQRTASNKLAWPSVYKVEQTATQTPK